MPCDLWPHPAYSYYINSLKVEVSQSHPVMKAFCGLLLDMMVEGGRVGQKIRDAEEGRDPKPQPPTHTHKTDPHIHATPQYGVSFCPDSLLLHAFRDSGESAEQGYQPSKDPFSLAAAVHSGQQPVTAGLQEALPDTEDLRERPEWDPQPQLQERQQQGGQQSSCWASPVHWDPNKPR